MLKMYFITNILFKTIIKNKFKVVITPSQFHLKIIKLNSYKYNIYILIYNELKLPAGSKEKKI